MSNLNRLFNTRQGSIAHLPDYGLPSLQACMEANLSAARLTNPAVEFVGVCINSSRMAPGEAAPYLAQVSAELGLPAVDPFADGVAPIVDRLA